MPRPAPIRDPAVSAAFASYPPRLRKALMRLRDIIFSVAAKSEGVGALEETLKWGEPSYLTTSSRSGTTVRIGGVKDDPSKVAVFVHCQTNLVAPFRERYPQLDFDGNRGIRFDAAAPLPENELRHFLALALTYHVRKRHAAE